MPYSKRVIWLLYPYPILSYLVIITKLEVSCLWPYYCNILVILIYNLVNTFKKITLKRCCPGMDASWTRSHAQSWPPPVMSAVRRRKLCCTLSRSKQHRIPKSVVGTDLSLPSMNLTTLQARGILCYNILNETVISGKGVAERASKADKCGHPLRHSSIIGRRGWYVCALNVKRRLTIRSRRQTAVGFLLVFPATSAGWFLHIFPCPPGLVGNA